jgi:hypothetical protein
MAAGATATCLIGLIGLTLGASAAWAQGHTAYVLTRSNTLLTIDTANPGTAIASVPVTGVVAGETLVGIDIRPQNRMLYALGVNAGADTMSLYLLSPRTGVAGLIGAGSFAGAGNLPDPADSLYGLDFNPTADRLRVTTNHAGAGPAVPGLNFRLNPNVGLLAAADNDIVAPASIDEIAYTNNNRVTTITTLYAISSAQDVLTIQNPPNNGVQTLPIALSTPLTAVYGFDIDASVTAPASNAPVAAGTAFAVVTAAGGTGLVTINLVNGAVSAVAPIAGGVTDIRGFAMHDIIADGDMPAFGLSASGLQLLRFNTSSPGTVTTTAINPAGLAAGDSLAAIDLRPQTGQLFALGYNGLLNDVRIYQVDPQTGAVTIAGAPIALPMPAPTAFGMDFNPTADRIRIVDNSGTNIRFNPDNGALAGSDGGIGPAPHVVSSAAYTNSFGQSLVGGVTTLYTLDAVANSLSIQNPPNNGFQTLSQTVTLNGVPLDFTEVTGFDIPAGVRVTTSNTAATGRSYAALTVGGVTGLYAIELSTAVATFVGPIATGATQMTGFTVGEAPQTLSATTLTSVSPAHVGVAGTVTVTAQVTPAQASGLVTFFLNGALLGQVAPVGGIATLTVSLGALAEGSYTLAARYEGSPSFVASTVIVPQALEVGGFTQHFAEGATGFFQTDIGVLNARSDHDANVKVRLFPEGAPTISLEFVLAPWARRTLNVNAIMGALGLAGGVSTLIESDQPIGSTRQMTWGSPVYGSTLESGVPDTSTTWYFAEGAASVYSLFYLIENPGSTQAAVTFTHLLEGGAAPIVQNETVAPFSRRTFFINDVPGIGGASLSTAIQSSVPIVAERAMYLNTSARQWEGGTASAGATSLSTTWSLAEGATGFFYTYLLLGNPGVAETSATVCYQLADGTVINKMYQVSGQSRLTIDVRAQDPLLESATVGMTITSALPIVAERVMWWGLPFYEGSVALGSTSTGKAWAIGEGAEGGANGEATFVLVSNNATDAGTVKFTVMYDDGTQQEKDFPLVGSSRLTVRIGTDFPDSTGKRFSVYVQSLGGGAAVPVTVEYARYQTTAGFLDGGGGALATRVQ